MVKLPVSFFAAKNLVDDISWSMKDWNDKIGKEVFVFQHNDGSIVNFVLFDKYEYSSNNDVVGYADRVNYPHTIGLKASAPFQNTRNIIQHELGHIIGLSHSKDSRDLMYYATRPGVYASPNDVEQARKLIEVLEHAFAESD